MAGNLRTVTAKTIGAICLGMLVCVQLIPAFAQQNVTSMYEDAKRLSRTGQVDKAIERYTEILALLTPTEHNAYTVRLARAQAYMKKGDLTQAKADIADVMSSPEADSETIATALRLKGQLFLKNDKKRAALKSFTQAIKTPHENEKLRSACFTDRGITFINLEDTDRAVSDLNKAIQLDPESGLAYAARGMAYLRSDRIEAAKQDGEKALRLSNSEQATKLAREILKELSASASGPAGVSVPLDERGHLLVQVRFSKKGPPHRFLLDTGATNTLIDESLLKQIAAETEVVRIGKSQARIADGSVVHVTRYKVKTAFLYHLPLGEIEVHVLEKSGGKLLNLLGMRSLRHVSVNIDNAKRVAEIRRTDATLNADSSLE